MVPQPSMTETRDSQYSERRPPRRRQPNFPPSNYNDMTRADMSLLAPLLLPPHPAADRSAHEKALKKRIAALPQHLQAKHPWLSSYCSVHSKFNAVLLDNLFATLRAEVEDELAETWVTLKSAGKLSRIKCEMVEVQQNLAVLWLGSQVFAERHGREARMSVMTGKGKGVKGPIKCAACLLTAMGANFNTIIAMAGCFIGRIVEGIYQKSKRVWWFEAWVGSCIIESKRPEAIKLMWDIGLAFRKARVEAREGFAGPEQKTADSMLAGPGFLDTSDRSSKPSKPSRPSRPPRKPSQDGDVDFVRRQSADDVEMDDAWLQEELRESEHLQPDNASHEAVAAFGQARVSLSRSSTWSSFYSDRPAQPATDEPEPHSLGSERTVRPGAASSVYSRNAVGNRATAYEIDDIISLYRHSKLIGDDFQVPTQDPASLPPVPAIPDAYLAAYLSEVEDPTYEPELGKTPPQPRYNNPHPLENVTFPRKDPDRDSKVSRIFKQSKDRKPALRTGKKGEVKTAFDAVSVKSQESDERDSRRRS